MQQVGKTIIDKVMRTGRATRSYMTYKDVEKDETGWSDPRLYLPRRYDLVYVKLNTNKILTAWRTDSRWEGRRMEPQEKVIGWKKAEDVDFD